MDTLGRNNFARLRGTLAGPVVFSHQNRQERFFRIPLCTERLSGTEDVINVLARERLLQTDLCSAARLAVTGEIRTFNNTGGEGARLVISLFARSITPSNEETDENLVLITGTICKPPILRRTPLGREICDLMLAVNRHYGRSDYLPCLVWGARAYDAADWNVGTVVSLAGRFQSRKYHKVLPDGTVTERTAYEISVTEIERT